MFKLFSRKTAEVNTLNDDINYDLDVSTVPFTLHCTENNEVKVLPIIDEREYNEFQELSLNECFAVILERLDNIEAKIDKIK